MVRKVKLEFQNGSTEEGAQYKTFYIDSKLYLEELKIEAMLRGAKFVQKKFSSLQEILALKEAAIFNCTNQSSSYFFEDSEFQEQNFLLMEFEGDKSCKEELFFRGKGEEEF